MRFGHLTWNGITVTLPTSKTDQEGTGKGNGDGPGPPAGQHPARRIGLSGAGPRAMDPAGKHQCRPAIPQGQPGRKRPEHGFHLASFAWIHSYGKASECSTA
jgi:hypothetical protein